MILQILFSLSLAAAQPLVPRIYEVRAPGTDRPSYILGTVHTRVHLLEFPDDVYFKIDRARIVLTELALSEDDIRDYARAPFRVAAKYFTFEPEGEPLTPRAFLGLKRLGFDDEFLAKTHDRDCAALSILDQVREIPLDVEIQARAEQAGVPVAGLDTPELRERTLLDKNPWHCSLNLQFDIYGEKRIDELWREHEEELRKLVDTYRSGGPFQVADTEVITRRNEAWLVRLRAEFTAGGAFVAVGVGHVEDLLNALTREGFQVITTSQLAAAQAPSKSPARRQSVKRKSNGGKVSPRPVIAAR